MEMPDKPQPTWKQLADTLRDTVKNSADLPALPLECARIALRSDLLDKPQKKRAAELVRGWGNYVLEHEVPADNPFAIRYHIASFAEQTFGQEHTHTTLYEVDINEAAQNGLTYRELIESYVNPDVIDDEHVALVGGASRIALKMYAGVGIESEIPINDIDAIISASADVPAKAEQYGIDITGAKIVDGDVRTGIAKLMTNFDCTMNQAVIHNGKLIFTERALQDVREGNIRLIGKNDPLFGSEGSVMPDGNVYLNRTGFYRGLSFLVRGKGERLIVSQENLEREKGSIGRYWLILFLVKILPMKDEAAQYDAIGRWHEIAQRLECTEATDPEAFFLELMEKYPGTNATNTNDGTYDAQAQTRWLIGKLTSRSAEEVTGGVNTPCLPETYTPANIELDDSFPDYNFGAFKMTVLDRTRR